MMQTARNAQPDKDVCALQNQSKTPEKKVIHIRVIKMNTEMTGEMGPVDTKLDMHSDTNVSENESQYHEQFKMRSNDKHITGNKIWRKKRRTRKRN